MLTGALPRWPELLPVPGQLAKAMAVADLLLKDRGRHVTATAWHPESVRNLDAEVSQPDALKPELLLDVEMQQICSPLAKQGVASTVQLLLELTLQQAADGLPPFEEVVALPAELEEMPSPAAGVLPTQLEKLARWEASVQSFGPAVAQAVRQALPDLEFWQLLVACLAPSKLTQRT